ncbi:MAG: DNA translocase FtsK [Lachnospiraceae bacterium]|nr:DNA translocase FtsK [Lachnospiraceae bacterium]MBP1585874.1 DNA translocase FtsK [Lachnospiraceae bacterium]
MYRRDDDPVLPIRMTGAVCLFLVFGIFSEMLSGSASELAAYSAGDIYRLSSEGRNGGGVIAGSISFLLKKHIGTAGEFIICLLILILSLFAINRQFFSQFFKNLFISATDKTGEFISETRVRNEERRQRLAERERVPELPDNGNETGGEDLPAEQPPASREALTVTEKINKEREGKKKEVLPKVSSGLETWKNNVKKRTEEEHIKKEQNKKIREETEDARNILKVEKAPARRASFEPKHTGEMHQMNYVESDDVYEDEEPGYRTAPGGWDDPGKRPGSSKRNADEEAVTAESSAAVDEPYEDDGYSYEKEEVSFEKVQVNSEHRIKVSGHPEDEASAVSYGKKEPEKPVAAPAETAAVKPVSDTESISSRKTPAAADTKASAPKKTSSGKAGKFRYTPPSLEFLKKNGGSKVDAASEIREVQTRLVETLASFGIEAEMGDYSQGPTVTRYEFTVSQGTKLSRVVNLSDEIKMALAATDIRIEAPIPGKSAIGIEVPNSKAVPVLLGDLLSSRQFGDSKDPLSFAVGKDIEGNTVVTNIAKFPHVLIAGTTGSGKSVCINTLILSLLYKSSPEDVQLILVDPKVVELKVYNNIPHLPFGVVTKAKAASEMLKWSVREMERRYRAFADREVRDIEGYNQYVEDVNHGRRDPFPIDQHEETDSLAPVLRKLPRIVIIIDELADLMMVAAKEVEESICRLAQLARAAGMHLVVATQRPSVDVITGLIKANMPSRIAFAVSSGVDSRTVLDTVGAEKLLGKGDMLFYPQGKLKPDRLQGAFVSDEEVSRVTGYLRGVSNDPYFRNPLADADGIEDLKKTIKDIEAGMDPTPQSSSASASGASQGTSVFGDDLFAEAGLYIIRSGKASIGYLQRVLKIGFNRAARIMDYLAEYGVVGQEQGTKPRDILMTEDEFNVLLHSKDTPPE